MNKRGVELSMNVIIIAAIALIVLVVLVLLVTGAFGDIKDGTGCNAKPGGKCYRLSGTQSCSDQGDGLVSSVQHDCPQGETCCWKPFS